MIGRFKHIGSVVLLIVFLLPSIVKLQHHHSFEVTALNSKNSTVLSSNCPICNFEFSIFISDTENFNLQTQNLTDNYFNDYNSRYNSNLSQFSFLLRAPPFIQI